MDFLRNTNIDFMKYRKFWIGVLARRSSSSASSRSSSIGKLNFGIDFAGGTQLTLKFAQPAGRRRAPRRSSPPPASGGSQIQRFGEPGDERGPGPHADRRGQRRGQRHAGARGARQPLQPADADAPTSTRSAPVTLAQLLGARESRTASPRREAAAAHYAAVAEAVMAKRKKLGIFRSWDEVAVGAAASRRQALAGAARRTSRSASFAVLARRERRPAGRRGAAPARSPGGGRRPDRHADLHLDPLRAALRRSAPRWRRLHDVLITLGLFACLGYEFNLTTIAAFLTLVGYSVNDTVVIFDRVRENMRKNRGGDLLDDAQRQPQPDAVADDAHRRHDDPGVALLFLFGGDVIKGFAFVMIVGIIVGTYSSIYIASPFALLWEKLVRPRRPRSSRGAKRGDAARQALSRRRAGARPRIEVAAAQVAAARRRCDCRCPRSASAPRRRPSRRRSRPTSSEISSAGASSDGTARRRSTARCLERAYGFSAESTRPGAPLRRAVPDPSGERRLASRRAEARRPRRRRSPPRRSRGHADDARRRSSAEFGAEVAELVDGVTKIGRYSYVRQRGGAGRDLPQDDPGLGADLRVVLVKLADRLHNMMTLGAMSPEARRRISQETLEIYAPIANRLGMANVKGELEDLAFCYLEPQQFALAPGAGRRRS